MSLPQHPDNHYTDEQHITSHRHVDTDPSTSKIMDNTEHHPRHSLAEQAEPQAREHHVRPPFSHQNSASSDSKLSTTSANFRRDSSSSASQFPLSPPLPPAHFNPVPDVHPLLLAATSRNPSNEYAAGSQIPPAANAEGDMQMVVSPLMSPSAGGFAFSLGPSVTNNMALIKSPPSISTPQRRYSGGSNVSATTPNTVSSQQSSPFHFAEFQTEIGTLQRRLSEERRRRSSAHSVKRSDRVTNARPPEIEAGNVTNDVINKTAAAVSESFGAAIPHRPTMKMSVSSGTASTAESEATAVEHLREARQELQAVLEEALEESCGKMDTIGNAAYAGLEPEQDGDDLETLTREHDDTRDDTTKPLPVNPLGNGAPPHAQMQADEPTDTLPPSPLMSPLITSPIPDSQGGGSISFEDLVRHQRRNSDSASNTAPLFSPGARSNPSSPAFQPMRSRTGSTSGSLKDGPRSRSRHTSISRSPAVSNTGSQLNAPTQVSGVSQLTKMRRTFSTAKDISNQNCDTQHPESMLLVNGTAGKNGAGERVYSPASILIAAEAANIASREQSRTPSPINVNRAALNEASVASLDQESNKACAMADDQLQSTDEGVSRVYRWRDDASHSDMQEQYPVAQSGSDEPAHHDTQLWDSVWPSQAVGNTSHALAPGHVPFPKPITDASPGLRPRLPMHSRTMSTNFGSGLVSNNTSPTQADANRMPMIHSLSFPRLQSSPHDRPAPLSTVPPYHSGVPLFFSSALNHGVAPSAWPQGSCARRGSLASLGSWPLNKNASADGSGDAPRKEIAEDPQTADSAGSGIPEEDETESDDHHVRSVQSAETTGSGR
ncbi:hypothetical protein QFC21_005077 [Naganishia friedmannii]|uniref:Uncharacterized protein n=1 Tax=Naganishia friedmannii TaxID=89922 RepID=A0ACC2VDV9_9TREE|nr:hypothetical protein QFC21_005077 [Naganishia friedmannii]